MNRVRKDLKDINLPRATCDLVLEMVRGLDDHVQVADRPFDPSSQHFQDTPRLRIVSRSTLLLGLVRHP